MRAGALDEPGTINYLVSRRLREMSDVLRERRSDEGRVVQVAPAPPPAPPPPMPPTPPR